jgi:hypothetical protein
MLAVRKIAVALGAAATIVLSLSAAAPAMASAAHPASASLPAYTSNCSAGQACSLLAQWEIERFAYGTLPEQPLIADANSDPYTWVQEDGDWGVLENSAGNCLNEDGGEIVTSGCVYLDHNELFWVFRPGSYPNGSYAIKNYAEGTGPNLYIPNSFVSGSNYITFTSANNAGTEITLRD